MKTIIFLLALVTLGCASSKSKQMDKSSVDKNELEALWQQVDSLDDKRLPQSAEKVIDQILDISRTNSITDHWLKALTHKVRYRQELSEVGAVEAASILEADVQSMPQPGRSILMAYIASFYSNYLNRNIWRIRDRTRTRDSGTDMRTWTVYEFHNKITNYYIGALEAEEVLKQTAVEAYALLLDDPDAEVYLRPTLFDLLAHEALGYFTADRNIVPKPSYAFRVDDPKYFDDVRRFVDLPLETRDKTGHLYLAMDIFQRLLDFRLARESRGALVDVNLERLKFVREQGSFAGKDSIYEVRLSDLLESNEGHETFTRIAYELAQYWTVKGRSFVPGKSDQLKWIFKDAFELVDQAASKFPNSYGAKRCRNLKKQLLTKQLSLRAEAVYTPSAPILYKIESQNISEVHLKVVPVDYSDYKELLYERNDARLSLINNTSPVYASIVDLKDDGDFHRHAFEGLIQSLPHGFYAIVVSDESNFKPDGNYIQAAYFHVTDIGFSANRAGGDDQILVFNRQSGEPLPGAKVSIIEYVGYGRNRNPRNRGTFISDDQGIIDVELPSRNQMAISVDWGEQHYESLEFYYINQYRRNTRASDFSKTFTDRAIYRPGQEVHFKTLIMHRDADRMPEILKNTRVRIGLYDVNGQLVKELKLTSNEFGSVNGTFFLPTGKLTGRMTIRTNFGESLPISVEEYKRPSFKVGFDSISGLLALGDTVVVTGSANTYAGVALSGATVRYRVVREVYYPYMPYLRYYAPPGPDGESMEISSGNADVDENGTFNFVFPAIPDYEIEKKWKPVFKYRVEVDVTDVTGETQSNRTQVSVGYQDYLLNIAGPERMHADTAFKVHISAENHDGSEVNVEAEIRIHALNAPGAFKYDRYWSPPDRHQLSADSFSSVLPNFNYESTTNYYTWEAGALVLSGSIGISGLLGYQIDAGQLTPGVYKIEVVGQGGIHAQKYIEIYDEANVISNQLCWLDTESKTSYPGEIARILVASPIPGLHVRYDIVKKDNRVVSEWIMCDGYSVIEIPIREDDRGGFDIHFLAVHGNRMLNKQVRIHVPWTNKKLNISYETFRDHLYPGQDESWSFRISGPDKDGVVAEVLASMYDASLDAFSANKRSFSIFPTYSSVFRSRLFEFSTATVNTWSRDWYEANYENIPARPYPKFFWFDQNFYASGYYREGAVNLKRGRRNRGMIEADMIEMAEAPRTDAPPAPPTQVMEEPPKLDPGDPFDFPVRENLNETVFFYPDIRTDENGDVRIAFKMNEALTTWKFQLFAHTASLESVISEREVKTQKDLMIVPNLPRFMRSGDELHLRAKVSNLSDSDLPGSATIQLLDPLTNEVVTSEYIQGELSRPFQVDKGGSAPVSWKIAIEDYDHAALMVRVRATSGDFSDGEQHILPILTNRILVTETMPVTVRSNEARTFNFESLANYDSRSLAHQAYTLEFTNNPAWYALQAMPFMMQFPYACTEQVFHRFYANMLGTSLMNRYPGIKHIMDSWKGSGALKSNLLKNEELKSALLEETPWVLDAIDQTEQMKRLALFFDLNKMSNGLQADLDILRERQMASGAFPWFTGGRENWYVTQLIAVGLGHLSKLGVEMDRVNIPQQMILSAIEFCDAKAVAYHERNKSNLQDRKNIPPILVHWMYMHSFFPEIVPQGQARELYDMLKDMARNKWQNHAIYETGLLALILHRDGNVDVVADMMSSLNERAIKSETLGMYWKSESGWNWYQMPIEMHAALLEAYQEITENQAAVDELRIHLLKNKQTNHWKTTTATARAVYALLSTGTEWLDEDAMAEIAVGGEQLDIDRAEAGTGYFKTRWDGDAVTKQLAQVHVKNPNDHIAWGAAYWQYFEDLDKVEYFKETPVKIDKAYYRTKHTPDGPELRVISASETMEMGDRIRIKLTIEVDRPMEFMHLKDLRPSGLEPVSTLSGYRWQGSLGYYESTRDLATHFFFDYLPKGTHVLEYDVFVNNSGTFAAGPAELQSMYAPEFTSHAGGQRLQVDAE